MSQAHDLHLPPPTRDDWRAALAEWADPVTGTPPEHLPDPLPEDLMDALATFQKVDDQTPPASELEVVGIVRAVHQAEAEQHRETASGWRLLAAMLAVACLGLLLWRGTNVDRSSPDTLNTGSVVAATSVVELYGGVTRSAAPATTPKLPESDFVVLLSVPDQLDARERLRLELVSGGETVGQLDLTADEFGVFSAQIRRDLLPAGPLTLHLRSATDEDPVATWTLTPAETQDEPSS